MNNNKIKTENVHVVSHPLDNKFTSVLNELLDNIVETKVNVTISDSNTNQPQDDLEGNRKKEPSKQKQLPLNRSPTVCKGNDDCKNSKILMDETWLKVEKKKRHHYTSTNTVQKPSDNYIAYRNRLKKEVVLSLLDKVCEIAIVYYKAEQINTAETFCKMVKDI